MIHYDFCTCTMTTTEPCRMHPDGYRPSPIDLRLQAYREATELKRRQPHHAHLIQRHIRAPRRRPG